MKKVFLLLATLPVSLIISSNSTVNKEESYKNKTSMVESVTVPVETNVSYQSILFSTLRDSKGNSITLMYNNRNNTVTVNVNEQVLNMLTDSKASGIRLYNDQYVYEEVNGRSILKKGKKIIFDSKN